MLGHFELIEVALFDSRDALEKMSSFIETGGLVADSGYFPHRADGDRQEQTQMQRRAPA